jgi:hypothetical protein
MKLSLQRPVAVLTALAVLALTAPMAAAEDHIVPLKALHARLYQEAQRRAENLAAVDKILALPAAGEALHKAGFDAAQAHAAVSLLNDQELSKLALQARQVDHEVQGGLIVGLLAIIGLIVVIIIVVSLVR